MYLNMVRLARERKHCAFEFQTTGIYKFTSSKNAKKNITIGKYTTRN